MAAQPKSQKQINATGLIVIIPTKVIVLIDGFAIGPFETGEAALAWAMDHSKNGIYQLKELYNPMMEI